MWIIGSPDATAVKSFLGNLDVRLLRFPMAEAFTRIFPELVRLVLPKGVVDIDRTIPADDVQLIGTTSKVLVRSDLHPEIVELLLQTMTETHSGPEIFQRGIATAQQWIADVVSFIAALRWSWLVRKPA